MGWMGKSGVGKIYSFFEANGRAATVNRRSYKATSGKFKRKFAWFLNLKKHLRLDFRRLRRRLVVLLLLSISYAIFFFPLFSIQTVEVKVTPAKNDLEEEILKQEIKKRVSGANLLFLSSEKLAFLSEDVTIANVKVRRIWTRTLGVEVEKRVPKIMVSDARGQFFLADDEGTIFLRGKMEELPAIRIPKNLSLGEKLSPEEIDFVLTLFGELSRLGLSLDFLEASEYMRFRISEGPEIISPLANEKISVLLSVLKNYQARGIPLKKMDLRHAHPVVEY